MAKAKTLRRFFREFSIDQTLCLNSIILILYSVDFFAVLNWIHELDHLHLLLFPLIG